jgi:K+-sensing histidine kinase KdpD
MPISPLHGYIGAGIALSAFLAGWTVQGWRYQSKEADALEQAYSALNDANKRANDLAADYEIAEAALNEYSKQTAAKVRVIYRDRKISADCALPADAAILLNEARDNANSAITGKSGGAVQGN